MLSKQVKVLGKTYNIAFNLAVQVGYEEFLKKPFNINDMRFVKNRMACICAAIIVNNPDTDFDIEGLIHNISREEMIAIENALTECMSDWYDIVPLNSATEKSKDKTKKPS